MRASESRLLPLSRPTVPVPSTPAVSCWRLVTNGFRAIVSPRLNSVAETQRVGLWFPRRKKTTNANEDEKQDDQSHGMGSGTRHPGERRKWSGIPMRERFRTQATPDPKQPSVDESSRDIHWNRIGASRAITTSVPASLRGGRGRCGPGKEKDMKLKFRDGRVKTVSSVQTAHDNVEREYPDCDCCVQMDGRILYWASADDADGDDDGAKAVAELT